MRCFCSSGEYVTGDISEEYLEHLHAMRNDKTLTMKSMRMLNISTRYGERTYGFLPSFPFVSLTVIMAFSGSQCFALISALGFIQHDNRTDGGCLFAKRDLG